MTDSINLTTKVYNLIRNDILRGVYAEGSAITENSLAAEYNVSRTPVREALRQLEQNELVVLIPNKGAVVQGISLNDLMDVYEIRTLIEGEAAYRAATRITPDGITTLEEITDLTEFYYERGNYDKLVSMDGKFHECLYDQTGSRIMRHVLSELHSAIQAYRKMSILNGSRTRATVNEHRALLEAIRAHDAELAKKLMQEHVNNSLENLKSILKKD